jgi:mono/diheme cytochrome c family protein
MFQRCSDLRSRADSNCTLLFNVAQVIISGGPRRSTSVQAEMPAFGNAYSELEIASVANYVTSRFGALPSSLTAERIAKLRNAD